MVRRSIVACVHYNFIGLFVFPSGMVVCMFMMTYYFFQMNVRMFMMMEVFSIGEKVTCFKTISSGKLKFSSHNTKMNDGWFHCSYCTAHGTADMY